MIIVFLLCFLSCLLSLKHATSATTYDRFLLWNATKIQYVRDILHYNAQQNCQRLQEYVGVTIEDVYESTELLRALEHALKDAIPKTSQVFVIFPPQSEVEEYLRLPEPLTAANEALKWGKTWGKDKAILWSTAQKGIMPSIPLDHPRQNASYCYSQVLKATEGPYAAYSKLKDSFTVPFLNAYSNVVISDTGDLGLPCGFIQHRQGCVARVLRKMREWRRSFPKNFLFGNSSRTVYEDVFVIDALWDFNYHHFLHDSVLRLVPFLSFLRNHSNIKIKIRADVDGTGALNSLKMNAGKYIQMGILALLGLETNRLVYGGEIEAIRAYVPNAIGCNSPLKHSIELRRLSIFLQQGATRYHSSVTTSDGCEMPPPRSTMQRGGTAKRNICVQDRQCVLPPDPWRCFRDAESGELVKALENSFPLDSVFLIKEVRNYSTIVLSGAYAERMACGIKQSSQCDMLVGFHGAGLTNMMFMNPGGVVAEIVGQFDGRMVPICGYHGPLAAVFALHHYIYYFDGHSERFNVSDFARELKDFDVQLHHYSNPKNR